ncbi:MAG: GDP-mannose-dependent alpha-(1-2)-phosphatidylinositol mannosyltransferase [candidate division WS6 bacterium OLB20]|uniref:GDP-mannose-dependent alpha-(1-2)-phosphatidylinositol mannosyltransferase n=1 Tax=candidate division WS6 bacterium OLB20 TaxID=1617426 RepID=A0A136LWG4_9BACT|nr:MAG: GDP-mannose-dependent alpha-(1-2)-phosphatidylinositol mannosyltransferase [candidate division WS6 bacterium OLB20]
MRIGIDITFLFDQYSSRGIGTYGKAVVSRLITDSSHTWILFGFKSMRENLDELGVTKHKQLSFVSLGKPRSSNPLNLLRFRFSVLPKIRRAKLDVFFAPHFERGLPVGSVKTAVMMHDVIPFVTGVYSRKGGLANTIKGIFYRRNLAQARKADLVITNSDFSERELIQKGGFSPEKVERIYLGVNEQFRKGNISGDDRDIRRVLMMYKISQPYILYYGGLETNKNVSALIHAFKGTTTRYPDLKLVLVGKDYKVGWDNKPVPQTPEARAILELIEELKLRHKVLITGEVDFGHMPIVLQNAKAFVHLSTYEGFGFSVLEAASAGIPVIIPRRSSYPELLGEAPLFVNPEEPQTVTDAILETLSDEKSSARMIKAGIQAAQNFNWEQTAAATKDKLLDLAGTVSPLRIGMLLPYFHPFKGGAETNGLELARRMVDIGHSVEVFTGTIPGEEDLPLEDEYAGIRIHRLPRKNSAYYLSFYPALFMRLLRTHLDLLHVHGFGFIWHDFCLLFKRLLSRTVMINTPHGPFMAHGDYSFRQKLFRSVFTFMQSLYLRWLYRGVIEVNPSQKDWIMRYRIPEHKIGYLPNGISEECFGEINTDDFDSEYDTKGRFVITCIGRYEKYKGLEDLIHVTGDLIEKRKDIVIVAIGRSGDYLSELQNLVKEMKLQDHVKLLVGSDDTTKLAALARSEVFVMPSRWEAFGISMLEAMAQENAIISTRTEGGEFLIKDGVNGLLYDYGDQRELRSHLQKLLDERDLRRSMQDENKKKARDFTWDKIADEYADYIKLITR